MSLSLKHSGQFDILTSFDALNKYLPFSNVEDPWSSQHEDFQVARLDAAGRDLLEGPVPVVVVIRAEYLGAVLYLVPDVSGEGHPHVVLRGHPVSQLGLKQNIEEM